MVSGIWRCIRGSAVACAILAFATVVHVVPAWSASTVLTVDGRSIGGGMVELTLEQLRAMPQTTVTTENEFVDGPVAYRGPLARDVVALLEAQGGQTLTMTAINDFAVEVPMSDVTRYDVILALEADGKTLSRRGKGPIWLMYPISDNPELRGDPVINTRLIWQLIRIEAK